MAKRIRISSDAGTTWFTLPGNSGEFQSDAGELDDTIFGQDYKSSEIGIINWSVKTNAFYKGFAGYQVDLKKSGTPTTFTTEACTLISGKTYQVNDTTKQVWDRLTAVNVFDGGVNKDAFVESIDFIFGRVTFLPSYTVTGAVTVTGKYLPMTVLASYKDFTLGMSMDPKDTTDVPTAQSNGGYATYEAGLKTVTLELSGVFNVTNAYRAALAARSELILEINPDGTSKSVARGYFKPIATGQSGDVGALEEETVSFRLQVPSSPSNIQYPFRWSHAVSTTLNTAVQKILTAWQDGTVINVQYLPDGSTGVTGQCVISDCTLTGGLESMNNFDVQLQGSGAITAV